MYRSILILLISVAAVSYAQEKRFIGTWISSGPWSFNYYQIKKNNRVNWYSEGCTNRGTNRSGTWTIVQDTITLTFEKSSIKLYLNDRKLLFSPTSKGMKRTHRITKRGAIKECIKERKKDKRKRDRNPIPDKEDRQSQINVQDICYRKQGYWIYYGKDRPNSGIPADGKVEEGKYLDGRKEGTWIKYHKDGKTPWIIGIYKNNRPVGLFQKFDEFGKLKEKGTFTRNRYVDSLIRWYSNGELQYVAFYDSAGHEQGQITYYYENGCIEESYFVTNGKKMNYVHLSETGDTLPDKQRGVVCTTTIKQKNPQTDPKKATQKPPLITVFPPNTNVIPWNPNGDNKVYNSDNEIWLDGAFKDGELCDGKVYVYDSDGILLKVEIYRSGFYFADGNL
ncbi:MAG: toxin-antitoxin system YwqK family antitoxin [Fluviicola sp.]